MWNITNTARAHARWLGVVGVLCSLISAAEVGAQECVPQCRSGYVCASGTCVSACNPVCDAGQSCVNGDCVSSAPPAGPPQSYPPAGPAQPPAGPPQPYPQGSEQAPPPEQEPDADASRGAFTHDGFFLQLALGVGFVTGRAESDLLDIDVSGIAQLGHLALGGTLLPGLVLGGGVFGANVPTTKYELGPAGVDDFNKIGVDGEASSASLVAGFATYYLEPLQQFFLTAGLGAALLSTGRSTGRGSDQYPLPETTGTGFGALAGFGFELFVAEQWSVGGLLRVLYLSADLKDDSDNKTGFTGWVPGLMMVGTYH